ncbi:MAG: class I SAM-dependent methyltransferase, partial [Casimicrobium sp.]
AHVIAYLIARFQLASAVDIGVYRGRSFLPMCIALRENGHGIAHAVDPWSKTEAAEKDNHYLRAEIDAWIERLDFDAVYRSVIEQIKHNGLEKFAEIHRTTSREAALYFASKKMSFDLIHIDGNHDTNTVVADVETYLPLLNANGFLVIDDVSWSSVLPAVERTLELCEPLMWRVTREPEDDYAIFVKSFAPERFVLAKRELRSVAGDSACFDDSQTLLATLLHASTTGKQ